jgi:hypothetical protein
VARLVSCIELDPEDGVRRFEVHVLDLGVDWALEVHVFPSGRAQSWWTGHPPTDRHASWRVKGMAHEAAKVAAAVPRGRLVVRR